MVDNMMRKSFPSEYDVKVQPGKKPDTLYFKIRYKRNKKSTSFKMYKNVVEENGRLVVNMNCKTALKMIESAKNYKEWKNDHKCGLRIKYDNGASSKSSSPVSSDKPVEGANLYTYCKNHCDRNVELNKKGMVSFQCYIDGVEIDKTNEKKAWDAARNK